MQKQILIVEDNALNREILYEILADQYSVLQAENGSAALKILYQYRDSIALILLDVMMPVMDGYTFLDRVKEDEELSHVPVIVMTQSNSEEDEVAALAHGATDFVPKPYRPQVILHRVASLIKLRETASVVNLFQFDQLTGVFSKEFFYRKVRELLDANPDAQYSIICSNIENFKLYNDSYGRKAGDRLLQQCAEVMKQLTGEQAICGRYGADRFMCCVESSKERADRMHFMEIAHDEKPEKMENVSLKWGIYEITDRSAPVEQMCDRAQLAADSIKGQYNQTCALYDDALRGKLLREKAITDAMETALAEEQFAVYLQPKYGLKEGCMVGAEALVRWNHPEWGFLSPGEFIPLFEKNGFIHRLDQYVWERVCALLSDWRKRGLPLLPISVNVSRADVYHARLVDTLTGLISKYNVDPAYLHLEITESAYAENPGQIIATVAQFRKLGFPIEMDDFGSGYSSLNMLSQMKLDILKLDMKFVQNEIAKPGEQSILNDIVTMAHRLHLSVVAEGVETLEQVKRLNAVDCDYAQGYFFSKPLTVPEFEALWNSQRHCPVELPRIAEEQLERRRLLLVEEDDTYREKVRKAFAEEYEVLEAADDRSALGLLREPDGFSAMILSLTMPGAGDVLKSLRRESSFWQTPVLATIPCGESLSEYPLVMQTDDFLCKQHPLMDLRIRLIRLMDMVAIRKRELALRDAVNRDYLTGLLNRRGLHSDMDAFRKEDLPAAVCMFDIDNMKQINDSCGHEVGDRILKRFAQMLHKCTRQEDILCRYGGDEFVVILKHFGDLKTAVRKCSDICHEFCNGFLSEPVCASCSAGVTLCGMDETPSLKHIEQADQALYQAKRESKGECCSWSADSERNI